MVFTPTFLYIKQHSVTGKLYFGKTIRNPEKYMGSGKHWVSHIKKHGKEHVVNLWYCMFLDEEICSEFAVKFSLENKIVESEEWLNIRNENGKDGAPVGHEGVKHTAETIQMISTASKKMWEENRETILENQKKSWTTQRREEQSERLSGERRPEHSAKMAQLYIDEPWRREEASIRMSNLIRTESHNQKISISLSGKKKTTEHIESLRKSVLNRTDERRTELLSKRRERARKNPKFFIEGVGYGSYKEASDSLGISIYWIKKKYPSTLNR